MVLYSHQVLLLIVFQVLFVPIHQELRPFRKYFDLAFGHRKYPCIVCQSQNGVDVQIVQFETQLIKKTTELKDIRERIYELDLENVSQNYHRKTVHYQKRPEVFYHFQSFLVLVQYYFGHKNKHKKDLENKHFCRLRVKQDRKCQRNHDYVYSISVQHLTYQVYLSFIFHLMNGGVLLRLLLKLLSEFLVLFDTVDIFNIFLRNMIVKLAFENLVLYEEYQ